MAVVGPEIRKTYTVALGNPNEEDRNTIVVGGTALVVPIELDLEGDPLHDEEVRVWSAGGAFDSTLAVGDEAVHRDLENRLVLYHFHDVPAGIYTVSVRTAGHWSVLIPRVVVSAKGVFVGNRKMGSSPPHKAAEPEGTNADDTDDDDDQTLNDPELPHFDQGEDVDG